MTEIVSYSELYSFDTCQRLHMYRHTMNLRPIKESDALATGNKGHKLLQPFYEGLREGMSKEEALFHASRLAEKLMKEEDRADFPLLKAWVMVERFVRENEFTAKTVLVENRFLIPASTLSPDSRLVDVQIGFTPDLVLEYFNKVLIIEDAKFVQRAWSKSKLNRYTQLKIYQLLLNLLGYNVKRCSIRMFNTSGNGSITEIPAGIKNAEDAKTVQRDLVESIIQLIEYKRNGVVFNARRTNNYTACQYCRFEYVCTQQAEGKDVSKTLKYEFVKSNYDYLS